MGMLVATTNIATTVSAWGDGAGGALTPETGYANANLVDGSVASDWRSDVAAGTHNVAWSLGTPPAGITAASVHDLAGASGEVPTSVKLYNSATGISGAWTLVGTFTLDTRGDGLLQFAASTRAHWKLEVIFGTSPALVIGELGLWTPSTLVSPSEWSEETAYAVGVVGGGEDNADEQMTKRGQARVFASLSFGRMLTTDDAAIAAVVDAAEASKVLVVPLSSAPSIFYHGRLQARHRRRIDVPIYSGRSWEFAESPRRLR
jgi:hypothetical protein